MLRDQQAAQKSHSACLRFHMDHPMVQERLESRLLPDFWTNFVGILVGGQKTHGEGIRGC